MSTEERLQKFLGQEPTLPDSCYIAPQATVIGDVRLGESSSVWPGCVLRGDINFISIGARSNVQDGSIIHLADEFPVLVGDDVTIGHGAIVHACEIQDECLIGTGSIILDGAVIGRNSIVGAGSLVTGGTVVPPGSLVLGAPAKVKRILSEEEQTGIKKWATKYVAVAKAHKARIS